MKKIVHNELSVYESINPQETLKNYDLDVRELMSLDDVNRAFDYATKKLCLFKVNLSKAELSEFHSKSKVKQYISKDADEDYLFLF